MRSIAPTSAHSAWNTSAFPRSKLSAEFSSGIFPVSPFSPKITTETRASVPLPFMSEVSTSITYLHFPPRCSAPAPAASSVTRGVFASIQSSW